MESVESNLYSIAAINKLPKNVLAHKIRKVLNRNQSETGGSPSVPDVKLNARVMFSVNVELQDRIVNGQLDTVKHILVVLKGNILKIYVKFDDCKAGLKKMNSDAIGKQHLWVPAENREVDIQV